MLCRLNWAKSALRECLVLALNYAVWKGISWGYMLLSQGFYGSPIGQYTLENQAIFKIKRFYELNQKFEKNISVLGLSPNTYKNYLRYIAQMAFHFDGLPAELCENYFEIISGCFTLQKLVTNVTSSMVEV